MCMVMYVNACVLMLYSPFSDGGGVGTKRQIGNKRISAENLRPWVGGAWRKLQIL